MSTRRMSRRVTRHKRYRALIIASALFLFGSLGVSYTVSWFGNALGATNKAVFDTYNWDGRNRLSLLLISDPYALVLYSPESGELTTLLIPLDMRFPIAGGYGEYRLDAIYGLGELEGQRRGAQFAARALSDYFGVPIDGYVLHADATHGDILELLRTKGKDPLWWGMSSIGFLSTVESNLPRRDLGRVLWALAWTRFDRVRTVALRVGEELIETRRKDEKIELIPVPEKIDVLIRSYLQDETVLRERQRVIIKNATAHAGLGATVGRRLANLGVTLVAVENASRFLNRTIISGAPSYTHTRVRQLLGSSCQKALHQEEPCGYNNAQELTPSSTFSDPRADIVVEVGEDEWRRFQ